MSTAGRCMAASTASGMTVGPGIARNSRPADRGMRIRGGWEDTGSGGEIYVAHLARRPTRIAPRRKACIAASALASISMANRSSSFDQAGPPRPAGRKRSDGSNSCSPDERSDIREQPRRSPSGMDSPQPAYRFAHAGYEVTKPMRERAPTGPFCMRHDLHVVRTMLDDHDLLGVMMIAPAVMMAAVIAALDDDLLDGFRLRGLDRRRDERESEHGGERHGDVLHKVLLSGSIPSPIMRSGLSRSRGGRRLSRWDE